jgi:LPXTG-motif cell wall-anchored protein
VKNFLPSVRRLMVLCAAVAAGTLGALALASPVSAHQTSVTGQIVCDQQAGEWVITWTVTNTQNNIVGTFESVDLSPAAPALEKIVDGGTLPLNSAGPLTETQRLPGSTPAGVRTLEVHVLWNYPAGHSDVRDSDSGSVKLEGTCNAPTANPGAAFESSCEGVVTVTLSNAADATAPAVFTVTGHAGFSQSATVEAGKDATVSVPKANSSTIKVSEGPAGKVVMEGGLTPVANCLPVTGAKTGLYAAGGLALAGVGGALFVLFRRRRIRFVSS